MNYVACIAEGAAETAIIDILVDHHLLIFEREQMLDEQVLRCRNASTFESRYLRKGFSGKITVYRTRYVQYEALSSPDAGCGDAADLLSDSLCLCCG